MLNRREIKVVKFLCYSCSNNIKYISLTYELFFNKSSNIFSKKLCSHILSFLTLIKNLLTSTSSCLSSLRFLLTSIHIETFILRCLAIWIIWIFNVCNRVFSLSFSIWWILNILSSSFFCLCSHWRSWWWWRRRRLSIIIYFNWRRWWRWRLSNIYFNWRRWRLSIIIIYLNWRRWWRWRFNIIIYLNCRLLRWR